MSISDRFARRTDSALRTGVRGFSRSALLGGGIAVVAAGALAATTLAGAGSALAADRPGQAATPEVAATAAAGGYQFVEIGSHNDRTFNQLLGINNNGLGSSALGFANTDHSNWSLAWALHAGVAYSVSNNFKMEFAYRYLNMGSADTSEVLCGASGCGAIGGGPRAFYTLRDMDSHDFKLGMRWMFAPEQAAPAYAPPLMRKG